MKDSLEPIARVPALLGAWWRKQHPGIQISLALGILVAKSGVDIALRNIQNAYLPASNAFPEPAGYFSASIGQVWLTHTMGIQTTTQWVVLHGLLVVVGLTLAAWLAYRAGPDGGYLSLPIVVSATAVGGILVSVGMYDVFTVVGGLILILARKAMFAGIGAAIMVSGNPEQAVVASFSLLVLSLLGRFRHVQKRALFALALSLASWLLVLAWFRSNEAGSGRLELLAFNLAGSLGNFLSSPESAIWLWFGAGWLIVVCALLLVRAREVPILLISLVIIPGVASIITTDGWRVFAPIVLPSYLVVGLWLARDVVDKSRYRDAAVGVLLITLLFAPMAVQGPQWFRGQISIRVLELFGL